jgi:transposase
MGLPLIGLPQGLRIYLALEPVDMRKQYDGLWALASQHLGLDPKGGALIVFTNKTRDRIKLLHWDGSGVWILAKRLEQGASAGRAARAATIASSRWSPPR